jgi:hypothetical protein
VGRTPQRDHTIHEAQDRHKPDNLNSGEANQIPYICGASPF